MQLFALNCTELKDLKQYNNHYYAITKNTFTFDEAKKYAEDNSGYLAIPNDLNENTYLKALIGGGDGAWIGIYDSSNSANYCYSIGTDCNRQSYYVDIKNNTLSYANWDIYEPNNYVHQYDVSGGKQLVSPLGEHWTVLNGNNGKWNDFGNHINNNNNPAKYRALVEFDAKPDCYDAPTNVVDTFTNAKCNTQVYDNTTNILQTGTTFDCRTDIYNNTYCPAALSQCASQFDYDNGYSIGSVGQVTDYANKIGQTNYAQPIPQGNTCSNYSVGCSSGAFGWGQPASYPVADLLSSHSPIKIYQNGTYKGDINSWSEVTNIHNQCDGYGIAWSGNSAGCFSGKCNRGTGFSFCWQEQCNLVSFQTNGGVGCENGCTGYYCANTNSVSCPSGYNAVILTNGSKGCASTTYSCPAGYVDNGTNCQKTQEYSYYTYLCNDSINSQGYNYIPITSGGNSGKTDPNITTQNDLTSPLNSSAPPVNNCKREKFTCQANSNRPCSYVDNSWQCSPFPCIGGNDVTPLGTIEGTNDKKNDGWKESGDCAGQIYIFNGSDKRCRNWDMFFGLTGGGCCDKDKVFSGLVSCKDNEKALAKLNKAEQCHQIGEYCSKKAKLGFVEVCVQKSNSNCCFGSKLARAIHEQGRPQINMTWGTAESPQCRGFKPEEFQKLDFSKIDLSGTFDIPNLDQTKLNTTINNTITNFKNMLGN